MLAALALEFNLNACGLDGRALFDSGSSDTVLTKKTMVVTDRALYLRNYPIRRTRYALQGMPHLRNIMCVLILNKYVQYSLLIYSRRRATIELRAFFGQ